MTAGTVGLRWQEKYRTLPRWVGLTRGDSRALGLSIGIKILVIWVGMVGYCTIKDRWPVWSDWIIWRGWDGDHYTNIATLGYGSSGDARTRLVFFPLYGWLIRLLRPLVHDPALAGIIISLVASCVVAVLLFRLVRCDYDADDALRAVWFLCIFPTAYILQGIYTESLFITFVVAAFLAARRSRWLLAGLTGAAATLTHDTGLFLIAALGIEAIQRKELRAAIPGLALITAGLAIYLGLNYHYTGDPLAFIAIERQNWTNQIRTPWAAWNQTGVLTWMNPSMAEKMGIEVPLFVVIGFVGTLVSAFELRPSYTIWMALNWIVIACQTWDMSAPRLVLPMFPLFILFAIAGRRPLVNRLLSCWSLLFLGLFTSQFVVRNWAF